MSERRKNEKFRLKKLAISDVVTPSTKSELLQKEHLDFPLIDFHVVHNDKEKLCHSALIIYMPQIINEL